MRIYYTRNGSFKYPSIRERAKSILNYVSHDERLTEFYLDLFNGFCHSLFEESPAVMIKIDDMCPVAKEKNKIIYAAPWTMEVVDDQDTFVRCDEYVRLISKGEPRTTYCKTKIPNFYVSKCAHTVFPRYPVLYCGYLMDGGFFHMKIELLNNNFNKDGFDEMYKYVDYNNV